MIKAPAATRCRSKKRASFDTRNKLTTALNVKVNKINNDFRARQGIKTN
jgi:hypothetical protein